ncbi:dihydroxyacetone kinase phosphoryl donor subunit DhaM [Tessaracoccus caeni]|uniref:dihydroxyacetone kinase phosphoryl donor subunit DhaM n=1 Tax=Tessaracoccus caeni TaxID=3031239 RepID=UPI0023DC6C23|nr:dihydroxyacetone kinase phosphoryl donor subunit DhaM [Tessaracoccus caeni]MDF1487149.1 dihydroxyacetone kinase phosphoryl donor subunit DhaM [Tessaracoccus caeni]
MTVGIVVVSHSRALAEAAVALASEMVHKDPPPLEIAAGTPDGGFGTDAAEVMTAIGTVDQGDGVAIFTDLGSAIMSAEMAIEFLDGDPATYRIVAAPFVEGLVAGIVRASMGGSLEAVAKDAEGALASKVKHIGAR